MSNLNIELDKVYTNGRGETVRIVYKPQGQDYPHYLGHDARLYAKDGVCVDTNKSEYNLTEETKRKLG